MNIENDIIILDDFIEKNYQNYLDNLLTSNAFQWYYYEKTSSINNFKKLKHCYEASQFVHIFFDDKNIINSPYYSNVLYLLNGLQKKILFSNCQILRIKSNLQTKLSKNTENNYTPPHTDMEEKHYVFLYYVNENDGATFLFNDDMTIKNKILPKKGRAIIFDGKILHSSSHPINYEKRIVINFNLKF